MTAGLRLQFQVPLAIEKAGGRLNRLSRRYEIPKWEARLVMTTVPKIRI